jgi:4-amino-4-deoxy-L-arabinose transferase-like glycosyltransferase
MRELGAKLAPPYEINQMTQHPPGYYAAMAVPTRVLNLIDWSPASALVALRMLSAAVLLPLPYLLFRIARSLGATDPMAAAASFLPLAIPQFTYLGGTVTNDSLLVTLGAAVAFLSLEVAKGDTRIRRSVSLGLVLTAALLVKGLALALIPMVVLAYVLCARRVGWGPTLRPAATGVACSLVGLAWWVRNVFVYGTFQPSGYPKWFIDDLPVGDLSFGSWLGQFLDMFARTFWLNYGWVEMNPPHWTYYGATVLLLGLLILGVLRLKKQWALAAMLQLCWIPVVLLVLYGGMESWGQTATVRGAQGRYAFAGVAALLAVVAVALQPRLARWFKVAAAIPLVSCAVAIGALQRGVWHFYAGNNVWARIEAMGSWSPLRLRILALLLVLAAMAAAAGAVSVWLSSRRATSTSNLSGETIPARISS